MIRIGVAGTLTATHFDTKSCCDHVVTGGAEYTGGTSPSNVAVAADDTSWVFFGDRAVVLALLDANPPHTHTHTHTASPSASTMLTANVFGALNLKRRSSNASAAATKDFLYKKN